MFAAEMEKVTGSRSELHDEGFHNLNSPPDIIKMIISPIILLAMDMYLAWGK
jgi:hypothetical protein